MKLIQELLEFAPGNGDDSPSKKSTIYTDVIDFLKSSGIDSSPNVLRPNSTQGSIKFQVRNTNKLLNRHDKYQVEIDYDDAGQGYEHEWRIVKLNPYKILASKITGKQPDSSSLISKLKELFKK